MKHGTTRRWLWRFFAGTATAVVLASALVVYLMQRPPAVWREAQAALSQMSEQRREELAQGVMHRIQSAMNRLGPETLNGSGYAHDNSKPTALDTSLAELPVDETFEVELSSEELLAIASDWADQWIAQRGYDVPEQVGQTLVMIRRGKLMMAFELVVGSWQQVFSGEVQIRLDPDGMAHGRVSDLTAGSLPMPVSSVGDWLSRQLPESQADRAEKLGQWIAELDGFTFRPVLELEHRRRARVIAMQLNDDSLRMTMRLQDHVTYKQHNALMQQGSLAVTDTMDPSVRFGGGALADVPTLTD